MLLSIFAWQTPSTSARLGKAVRARRPAASLLRAAEPHIEPFCFFFRPPERSAFRLHSIVCSG